MNTTALSVAFIGTGLMGTPMVTRLLAAGFDVRVWNRTPEKTVDLARSGASVAASVAEACDGADLVCTCLSNASAVEHVVFGASGVTQAARAPRVLVDFSTIGPEATRACAARLHDAVGTRWLDAPVSGGPTGAASGKLVIFCGGDAGDVDYAQPLFAPLSQRVTHFGATGTGQAAKVCNQIIVAVTLSAIAESLSLAERLSIDASRLVEALKGGYADSIPLQIFGTRMASRRFEPRLGELSLMAKDLALARELAAGVGATLPIVESAAAFYEQACRGGLAHADLGELITLLAAATPPRERSSR